MHKIKENKISNLLTLFKYPLITYKAIRLFKLNKYTFLFDKKANKFNIKIIIEYLFNIKIIKINTLNLFDKKKIIGRFCVNKPSYKKVIITLKNEHKIKLFFDF